jgi:hypothetical protein
MKIIGCDLHCRQRKLPMLNCATRKVVKMTLRHEDDIMRASYSNPPRPVRGGIEAERSAVGSTDWGCCIGRFNWQL